MVRSISSRASIRRTVSSVSGETTAGFLPLALRRAFSARSAITKNGRRAWIQQASFRPMHPKLTQPCNWNITRGVEHLEFPQVPARHCVSIFTILRWVEVLTSHLTTSSEPASFSSNHS